MKGWLGLLLILVAALQYKLWFSDVGIFAERQLQRELHDQEARHQELVSRNSQLMAEAVALKQDPRALEARARRDLGMIKQGEVFFFVPDAGDNR